MRRRRRLPYLFASFCGLLGLAALPVFTQGAAAAVSPQPHLDAAASTRPPYGEIVVADGASILVFAPGAHGNAAPVRTISGSKTGLDGGFGATAVDLDAAGNIWIADYSFDSIEEFAANAHGNTAPLRAIKANNFDDLNQPEGIALDRRRGLAWIGNFNSSTLPGFAVTASGTVAPSRRIEGGDTGVNSVQGVALSPDGRRLWAAEPSNGLVQEYSPTGLEDQAPLRTLQLGGGAYTPVSAAVDIFGNVHVSDQATNSIFTFGPHSDTTPVATLVGAHTGIVEPWLISFDAAGHLWVASGDSGAAITPAISEFAPSANGNAAPMRRISGTATKLDTPEDVAVYGGKPGAARSLQAAPGKRKVTLSWKKPAATGGGVIGYQVRRKNSKHAKWQTIAGVTTRAYVDRHRTPHHRYRYDVIAVNQFGSSHPSKPATAVPHK